MIDTTAEHDPSSVHENYLVQCWCHPLVPISIFLDPGWDQSLGILSSNADGWNGQPGLPTICLVALIFWASYPKPHSEAWDPFQSNTNGPLFTHLEPVAMSPAPHSMHKLSRQETVQLLRKMKPGLSRSLNSTPRWAGTQHGTL